MGGRLIPAWHSSRLHGRQLSTEPLKWQSFWFLAHYTIKKASRGTEVGNDGWLCLQALDLQENFLARSKATGNKWEVLIWWSKVHLNVHLSNLSGLCTIKLSLTVLPENCTFAVTTKFNWSLQILQFSTSKPQKTHREKVSNRSKKNHRSDGRCGLISIYLSAHVKWWQQNDTD